MNILMFTNTYIPHIGGVAKSVTAFTEEYKKRGHQVMIVAPEFANQPEQEENVVRVPALQNFNGSDFSVVFPIPGLLTEHVERFEPDIVHSHHPYLLGMSALRIARQFSLPIVFTHHTLYEQYTHYVPADSDTLKRFVIALATEYANMCNTVFAPSESVATLLRKREVATPIEIVPTGVKLERYTEGDPAVFRRRFNIPKQAYVVGHLGRLAEEKNLDFLTQAVCQFLQNNADIHFLLCGIGSMQERIKSRIKDAGVPDRFHLTAVAEQDQLKHAYAAMDVFAFSSKSETQGMVLTEAMAAGVPVVALDASGVREVVKDKHNGRLLNDEAIDTFCATLQWMKDLNPEHKQRFSQAAQKTADQYSMTSTAETALQHYTHLVKEENKEQRNTSEMDWNPLLSRIKAEWDIVEGLAAAAKDALSNDDLPVLE